MYIPNTNQWMRYYEQLGKDGHNPYMLHKNKIYGKQIGGGSLAGTPQSFITSIGTASKPPVEEKVEVQLVSPVQQTNDMARDLVERDSLKKNIKRTASKSPSNSKAKRPRIKTQKKLKKRKVIPIIKRKKILQRRKQKKSSTKKHHNKSKKSNKRFKDIFG